MESSLEGFAQAAGLDKLVDGLLGLAVLCLAEDGQQ